MADYDVIIVGGGVMGCATAYHLLTRDANLNVLIIERDPTYKQNSTVLSDGNHRVQFNVKENIEISLYGLEVLKTFADDMAVDDNKPEIAFRQEGNLFLTNEAGRDFAQTGLALQQSLGCEVEWWDAATIEQRLPFVQCGDSVGGVYGAQDGTMNPNAVLIGYKTKAIALGAEFLQAEVTEFLRDGQQMTGVKLANGDVLNAPHIVNGAGAWGADLLKTIGYEIPMIPVRRQVFILDTTLEPETTMPLIVFPSGTYLIHEHGKRFMIGKSFADDPVGYNFEWDRQRFIDDMWEELVGYIPQFDQLKVVGGWSGLYAVNTFDHNAILGSWDDLHGMYLANGFSGHGFQQCHAVGRYLAELILDMTPTLDLSIFSPKRFAENRQVLENPHKIV